MDRDVTEALETSIAETPALKQTGSDLRNLATRLFLESPLRPLKNFLNGTWLEHPLHPVLTDVPVGAWTVAMALDALELAGVEGLGEATGIATGLGTAAALGAVTTGLMDYTDTTPPDSTVGFTHGLINTAATLLFGLSFLWRWRDGWRTQGKHVFVSSLGYMLITVGAYIGGSLVYRRGVMVNRNAYSSGPKDFVSVLAVEELAPNHLKRVDVDDQPVLLVKQGDRIWAIGAVCSHLGGPLEKGRLVDGCVECPWHYSLYRLEDGSYKQGPTTSPVPAYDTRINNGKIEVRLRQ